MTTIEEVVGNMKSIEKTKAYIKKVNLVLYCCLLFVTVFAVLSMRSAIIREGYIPLFFLNMVFFCLTLLTICAFSKEIIIRLQNMEGKLLELREKICKEK